ncbi:hypothetical protein AALB53_22625 [Lachnospiraceae bacterium 47-T17]
MKKRRRKIKPLAILLALAVMITGISLSSIPPTEAEAASQENCSVCGNGYGAHSVGGTIGAWAAGSGRSTILQWNESTATTKDAHVIQKGSKKYLAWYQRNKTATNAAHYHTDGYHLTASKYTLGGTAISMGHPDTCIFEGSGYSQVNMGAVSPGSGEHYTLYYIEYNKIIDMCKELGLKLKTTSRGTAYEAYLQPYISCYNLSGTRVLTSGSNYNSVYSMFCKLYSAATQADLKEKYNVKLRIPAVEIPIIVRYYNVTNPDDVDRMYNEDGDTLYFDTGLTLTICSDLYSGSQKKYWADIDFNAVLDKLSNAYIKVTRQIRQRGTGIPLGESMFVGCQASIRAESKFAWEGASSLGFNATELAKLGELSEKAKYLVATDDREKDTLLLGSKVTAERLLQSMLSSCLFEGVTKVDYKKITTGDKCYLDLEYMLKIPDDYKYTITRKTADYNPETKKYSNPKEQNPLIEEKSVESDNITDKKQFTKTIASSDVADYTDSPSTDALGNMVVDGHKYTLSRAKLDVTDSDGKTLDWNNVNEKATDWAGGSKLTTVGDNYAYKTEALTKKLKSYRRYTDNMKMAKYGDSAEWTIEFLYTCRPPMIRLNYKYDKDTKRYTLIDTVPSVLKTADDLNYEFANSTVTRDVETKKGGEPLKQVYVTTGQIEPYDSNTNYSSTAAPMPVDEPVFLKDVAGSDLTKAKYSVSFKMPYDTTYLVCVYGDDPPTPGEDKPGYTRVILDKTPDGYTVREKTFIPDPDPDAEEVTVEFESQDLVDVGEDYAEVDKPTIPDDYKEKPDGTWGKKRKDRYKYTHKKKPELKKNLIIYAIYERSGPAYTKVIINHTDDAYEVVSSTYVPDPNSKATSVTVTFSTKNLEDVGYVYSDKNQPRIPDSYSSKPTATWGQGTPNLYKYTGDAYPKLKQNLIVYAIYKDDTPPPDEEEWEEEEKIPGPTPDHMDGDDSSVAKGLSVSADAGDMRAYILNDFKASTAPDYKTETAIPTSEYLNTFAKVLKYLTKLDQIKHTANWRRDIIVTEYHYEYHSCEACSGWYLASTIPHAKSVQRQTVYYTLEDGNVLTPEDCTIFNDVLTLQEQICMPAIKANKYWENASLGFKIAEVAEKKRPSWHNTSVSSYGSYASDGQLQAAAEGAVGQYTSHNDYVKFGNGEGLIVDLSDTAFKVTNPEIEQAPEADCSSIEMGERVFDKWGVFIPADRVNGTHGSSSVVHYKTWASTAGTELNWLLGIPCNSVVIHTPAMCNSWLITDETKVQKLKQTAAKNLVLDTPFIVHCTAEGTHCSYPGYGYRDYQKWLYVDKFDEEPIRAMQVRFPFPVMRHSEKTGVDTYYVANTWIPVPVGDTEFYMPSWDDEIDYTAVRWRAIAENTEALESYTVDDGRTLKEADEIDPMMYQSRLEKTEYTANYDIGNYVGWMEEACSTSGRVYQMEIFDITDYPTWERVFRTGSLENPNELTGFRYTSGLKNRDGFVNGSTGDTTLPTVKGSNAYNANAGALSPGYAIRFTFETVGMLENANDAISIKPSFVWISPDGQTRKKADVYYTETFGGKQHQLVKVGSELDTANKHALSLGDDEWGVDQEALDRTAKARGFGSTKELLDQREYCWNPNEINLKSNMNTFDGWDHKTILSDGTPYSWDELKQEVVSQNGITGVTHTDVLDSVQNWYCNYYLPSKIYVTTQGTRIEDYVKTSFTGEEACWMQDGYLVINFDVVTVDGGTRRLTYNCLVHSEPYDTPNENGEIEYYTGQCNMWDWEGYINDKMNSDGITFRFVDGDMFMYELGKSNANSDYTNGGTH